MATGINSQTALLAVGILQPATPSEIRGYLKRIFPDASVIPPTDDYVKFLEELELSGRVISRKKGKNRQYALTIVGSHELSAKARRVRDKFRIYLLRSAHNRRVLMSRGSSGKELAGASPALDTRSTIKGSEANKVVGLSEEHGQQPCWPRISRQFNETGSEPAIPRDILPTYFSFAKREQAALAARVEPNTFQLDLVGLAVCIGISPKLISQIIHNPNRHYRKFNVPKKGNGERTIESPRVFLKTIQWALLDFFLINLNVSDSVRAFRQGSSIVANAEDHVGKNFVANFDIQNFFGSISTTQIERLLFVNNFTLDEASLIANLCTKDNHLPQGAPTSPLLSNAFLYEFDQWMTVEAKNCNVTFTRYADDITLSSNDITTLKNLILLAENYLRKRYSLRLNKSKTRISSQHGRQVVTGVVVNEQATPAREKLRRIRAIFHQASIDPKSFSDRLNELSGLIGYLSQFSKFRDTPVLQEYRKTLGEARRFNLKKDNVKSSKKLVRKKTASNQT